ncbi:MAG: sigma-54-dependent Fis family transcriptional regulator [Acidobacteria bacterium]|nr:sigma-54-dependent Fis family transcriptional regulator [Acidobacteriota bacterium]
MDQSTILIAEDERAARCALARLLENEGFRVLAAEDGARALELCLENTPEVALVDIRMPGLDGLSLLKRLRESDADVAVVVVTAYGTSSTAIEAMKFGAFDYLTKPLDIREVLVTIERALDHRALARELRELRAQQPPAGGGWGTMIGHSPAMQQVYKRIGQVAPSDATVLVRGESGTGKELVANAIHEHSRRARGPLVKINCASIPEALLEAELFGHEKGAFTGAAARRVGRFESADGGTVFLDEVAELSPALQAKLLRAIQERTIERLGSNASIAVDIRLVAATARDLEKAVADGWFRDDLYYRLNVVTIALPPLRERRQDIPALVQHFLRRATQPISITPLGLDALCAYDWPGNVRELENAVERAIALAHGGVITEHDLQPVSRIETYRPAWTDLIPLEAGFKPAIEATERALIERALRSAQGRKTRAAEILRIHRRLLYEKLRQHGL